MPTQGLSKKPFRHYEVFECNCVGGFLSGHYLVVDYWVAENDLTFTVFVPEHDDFWGRLKEGLRYIFGKHKIALSDVGLKYEDKARLQKIIRRLKKERSLK